jgi:rhamnosyltransferase
MKCSIIIRCYNEEEHIGRLLSGIFEQTIQDLEIILVDSGSTDATLAIASHYPVKILSIKPEDFSFGRSLNLGCQAAQGEFLAFASAHVYPVYRDWLEKLLSPFSDPQVALAYGKQRGDEVTKYSEHQIFAKWFPESSNFNQKHPFCNNANAAIRKKMWEQFPYDEELTGLEDIDWAKKAIALNYKIAYIAEAEIVHVHNETPLRIYNRYRREAIALKKIFPQENFNFIDLIRLIIINLINDYYHAFHDGRLRTNLSSIVIFRWMQFWGTYQGFARHEPINSQLKQTFYYPRGLAREDRNLISDRKHQKIDYSKAIEEKPLEQVH